MSGKRAKTLRREAVRICAAAGTPQVFHLIYGDLKREWVARNRPAGNKYERPRRLWSEVAAVAMARGRGGQDA